MLKYITICILFGAFVLKAQEDSIRLEWNTYDSLYLELFSEVKGNDAAYLADSNAKITLPSDSIIALNMKELNRMSEIGLDYNNYTRAFINLYAVKRQNFTHLLHQRFKSYEPLFEKYLDYYGLPQELKYLPIIESGLNTGIKSRVGAAGLWQFMIATGRMYGLEVNNYYDDRLDPERCTKAACLFLKRLYGMYGDWGLALSAYNAGPGNVNKAIRRSGGKRTFWEIRPFLPRETRGYYPALIAVTYLFENAESCGLGYRELPLHHHEIDSIHLSVDADILFLETLLPVDSTLILDMNPRFRKGKVIINKDHPKEMLRMPYEAAQYFAAHEDSIIYALKVYDTLHLQKEVEVVKAANVSARPSGSSTQYYTVRSGDVIGKIAQRYGVSVYQIRSWNGLRSNTIRVGQRLKIYTKKSNVSSSNTSTKSSKTTYKSASGTYVVKSGDSLWLIAKRLGTSMERLKQLNPGVDLNRLKIGQTLKI